MNLYVVSTGKNAPTKERCIASVREQTSDTQHVYVEAGNQDPPVPITKNLGWAIGRGSPSGINDDDVVVWLDGDDWLAHDRVLEKVAKLYEDPNLWLTYGSFRFADGRPGWCKPYEAEYFENEPLYYRREEWRGTHLRTFRAGLFRRIKSEDLDFELAVDQAVMIPMLELAGAAHARFVPEVLCVYNYASSFEHHAAPEALRREAAAVRAIRARQPYARLASL